MENTKNSNYEDFIKGTTEENNDRLKQECENLLHSSNYDDDMKSDLEIELWNYEEEELNKMKAMLLMNQTDRINAGHEYTQTDIKRKLKREIK